MRCVAEGPPWGGRHLDATRIVYWTLPGLQIGCTHYTQPRYHR